MATLRISNIWLRHRAFKKIKKEHKDLFNPLYKNIFIHFLNFISDRKNWILVFLFVVLCFWLPTYININSLNILKVDISTVKTIVDQRTTNLATIISISLVVVGFLLNNLAVKSPITYKLLFRKSLLYLTIYLTLSTIFCFIIASTLRDTIPEHEYTRLVLGGTYLCLLILFIIGYLFRKIIHFTNEKEISKMLSKELMNEGKEKIKLFLIKKYSNEILNNFLGKYGRAEFDFVFSLDNLLKNNFTVKKVETEKEENYRNLKNINLLFIKLFIKFKKITNKNDVIYNSLILDDPIKCSENDFLHFESNINTKFEKWFLRFCLTTTKFSSEKSEDNIYRNEFDQKIFQLAETNNYRNLEDPLDAYFDLYKLQMTNQK